MNLLLRLVREAHRRSLWQVLAIYLAASYAAYQVVLNLRDGIGLPDWVPGLAIVLLFVGLPIVLATAFVQEGGPASGRRGSPAQTPAGAPSNTPTSPPESTPVGSTPAPHPTTSTPEVPAPDVPTPQVSALVISSPAAHTLRGLLTWRRAILGGVLAFAALGAGTAGYMGMRVMGIGPAGTLVAEGVLQPRDPILLSDFQSPTGDTLLAAVVGQALRVGLAESRTVSLVEPARVRQSLQRMQLPPSSRITPELARQIALRDGFKAYLAGEVARAGGYLITARLVAADSDQTLVAFQETARDSTRLLAAVDKLSGRIRERVGESLKTIQARQPLEAVTTSSLEALRDFTLATRALDAGDVAQGLPLLQSAIAADTTFAMAYRRLSSQLWNLGRVDSAMLAARAAIRFQGHLTERERQETIAAYAMGIGQYSDAVAAYTALLAQYPDDYIALNNIGLAYYVTRQPARAESAYARALHVGQTFVGSYSNLIEAQVAQGRVDAAWRTAAAERARYPSGFDATMDSGAIAAAIGDYVTADSAFASVASRAPGPGLRAWMARQRAHLAAAQGRLADAGRLWDGAAEIFEQTNLHDFALQVVIEKAFGELRIAQRPDRASAMVDSILRQRPIDTPGAAGPPYLPIALLYAESGHVDRAGALLQEFETRYDEDRRRPAAWFADVVRGAIAMAGGRAQDAVRLLRAADAASPCDVCSLPLLAEAEHAAGDDSAAIATYQHYITQPSMNRGSTRQFLPAIITTDAFELARAHERVAQLADARGDRKLAIQEYGRFIALWKNADPELQPRVVAARQRMQALLKEQG
jgi:eukaryotic-like serine/threonine-protein kinase